MKLLKQFSAALLMVMLCCSRAFGAAIPNNEIHYISTDGKIVEPYKTEGLPTIVSNTYTNGQGVITFKGDVTKIGNHAFYQRENLKSISLPDCVGEIEQVAFAYCKALENLELSNSLTHIGFTAFCQCAFKTLDIPSSVVSIEREAFEDCKSLTSINIKASHVSFDYYVFKNCQSLKDVYVIAQNPTDIYNVFRDVDLSNVTLHCARGTAAKYRSADEWEDFGRIVEADYIPYNTVYYTSTDGKVVKINVNAIMGSILVSNTYDKGVGVITFKNDITRMDNSPFDNCKNLETVELPGSIKKIGICSFQYCTSLKSIKLPEVLDSIKPLAFISCSALESINISSGCKSIGEYAFSGNKSLKKVVLPESLTEIGSSAFVSCSALESINIPSGCLSIGASAFSGNSSLKEVILPESLTEIKSNTFNEADITNITIPRSVNNIETQAFGYCKHLENVYVDWNTPLEVHENAFLGSNCADATLHVPYGTKELYMEADVWKEFGKIVDDDETALTRVIYYTTIDGTVVNPKSDAFDANIVSNTCKGGKGVIVFDEKVTQIGQGAFADCTNLLSINLHKGLEYIGMQAFDGCFFLEKVTIPNSVKTIETNSFKDCKSLNKMYVEWTTPLSVDEYVFRNVNLQFAYLYVPKETEMLYNTTPVWENFGLITDGYRDRTIYYTTTDGKDIKLNKDAFDANIVNIGNLFGSGVITFDRELNLIGKDAFKDCENLETISIPNPVSVIDVGAFENCTSLSKVEFPVYLKEIKTSAFQNCTSLVEINLPDSLKSIMTHGFFGCTSLEKISFPEKLRSLMKNSFANCTSIKDVYVQWDEPVSPGGNIFSSVDLSNSTLHCPRATKNQYAETNSWKEFGNIIEYVPNNVIYYYSTDGMPVMPNIPYGFGARILSNNINPDIYPYNYTNDHLDKGTGVIKFEGTVIEIPKGAFCNCQNLAGVELPQSVSSISDSTFFDCKSLSRINIPYEMAAIETSAFEGCSSLDHIYLPNTLWSVGTNSFKDSGIKYLYVSERTSIGEYAFANCSKLKDVYMKNEFPNYVYANSFTQGFLPEATLHVPAGTVENYKAAKVWKGFGNIVEYNPSNEIHYTTTDGKIAFPFQEFQDIKIVKNNNVDGEGTVTFDGDVVVRYSSQMACSNLASIVFPDGLISLNNYAFQQQSSLESVTLPDDVISIGSGAFNKCTALKSFKIPSKVNTISDYMFDDCSSLEDVDIHNGVTKIGELAFERCSSLKKIDIPESVTNIGQQAFYNCTSLDNLRIPNSVTSIEQGAFDGCNSLTNVTIPQSVNILKNEVFANCESLADVFVDWSTPLSVERSLFANVDISKATLHVPVGIVDLYKKADVWKEFGFITDGTDAIGNVSFGNKRMKSSNYNLNGLKIANPYKGQIIINGGKKMLVK